MNTAVNQFEDLRVWKEAIKLTVDICRDMRGGNGAKDFGFGNQAQHIAFSIMNNIAEGFDCTTDADFACFLDIAKDSCAEVCGLYYLAEDLNCISMDVANERRGRARNISGRIAGLAKHLRGKS